MSLELECECVYLLTNLLFVVGLGGLLVMFLLPPVTLVCATDQGQTIMALNYHVSSSYKLLSVTLSL